MTDEQQIRDLVATWLSATRAGDVDTVLSLMADDAVFLVPGQPPMRKPDFAAASRAQQGAERPTIDGTSDIEELVIAGTSPTCARASRSPSRHRTAERR